MGFLIEAGMEYQEVSRTLLDEFIVRPYLGSVYSTLGVVLAESMSYAEALAAMLL